MANVLKVTNLCKDYGTFKLDNVSFCLEAGKITGFVGRNGAGKSTTLNCLLNIVHPTGGNVAFFDMDINENEQAIKSKIGFVSSGINYYQNKKLSAIARTTASFYPDWDDEAYNHYMKKFSLDESKTPAKLSAGMKVKFALTLALSRNSSLFILDEPTSGLDPVSRDELTDIFLDLSDKGKTVLFSTHITADLDKCAHNIIYIKSGKIIADAPLNQFKEAYCITGFDTRHIPREFIEYAKGERRTKDGCTALMLKEDAINLGLSFAPCDLDSIMVHMEHDEIKEGI